MASFVVCISSSGRGVIFDCLSYIAFWSQLMNIIYMDTLTSHSENPRLLLSLWVDTLYRKCTIYSNFPTTIARITILIMMCLSSWELLSTTSVEFEYSCERYPNTSAQSTERLLTTIRKTSITGAKFKYIRESNLSHCLTKCALSRYPLWLFSYKCVYINIYTYFLYLYFCSLCIHIYYILIYVLSK